ncbi:hypothetical protein FRB96_007243 [Tulasnella sp. 330]|nr:hypothetical protein FRB96_007243 [Tulasnella sp. 330]
MRIVNTLSILALAVSSLLSAPIPVKYQTLEDGAKMIEGGKPDRVSMPSLPSKKSFWNIFNLSKSDSEIAGAVSKERLKVLKVERKRLKAEEAARMGQPDGQVGEDSNSENNLIVTALDVSTEKLRQGNERQAIYSLPENTLVDIFFLILLEAKRKYYNKTLYISSQVSTGWALLIRKSPSLWSLINFDQSAQLPHIALSRSKESPIDIINRRNELGSNGPLTTA